MLLEDLHVGVMILGPGTHVEYANQAALDMWGFTAGEVLGKMGVEIGLVPVDEELNEIPLPLRPGPLAATGKAIRSEVIGSDVPGATRSSGCTEARCRSSQATVRSGGSSPR